LRLCQLHVVVLYLCDVWFTCLVRKHCIGNGNNRNRTRTEAELHNSPNTNRYLNASAFVKRTVLQLL